ncbi:VOC family protein [Mycobacterium sp. NPDC003323]
MTLRLSQIAVDAHDPQALAKWWSEVLGWPVRVDSDGDAFVTPPSGQGPELLFMSVPDEKVVKNRMHLDFRPDDQDAEVARVLALGARHVDIGQGDESWVVLADPEGNEFCILAPE